MNRRSKYHALKFIVEAKWPDKPFYEPIAAFDHFDIASEYAMTAFARSAKAKLNFNYQVVERNSRGYTVKAAWTHGKPLKTIVVKS